ncbi:MAG TPA: hypothetical protein DCX21_06305 [Eubacterium sp.]|nr:hypothetical protein [Eubacterium sp.]
MQWIAVRLSTFLRIRACLKILKENGVLSRGHLVEVGRKDLVGQYVGWTAPLVRRRFKEAIGGVLFIDEAYSLVDGRDKSFGDEAINTIVQEMENHRDELIVIFAGYPNEMEEFLESNPGLRSRIAHYVHFDDYSKEELCAIAEHIARGMKLVLDDGAKARIADVMEEARTHKDFGNGRFVRNVIEKAWQAQKARLIHGDIENIGREEARVITAADVVVEKDMWGKKEEKRGIGFV